MATFTLTVNIDRAILNGQGVDKLVIARKVNENLNTVFDGYGIVPDSSFKQLNGTNVFSWKENFKVFLTSAVNTNDAVTTNTNEVDIPVGSLAKYEKNQINDPPIKQGHNFFSKPGSFGIEGVPHNMHVGVKMATANGAWSTIYVDQHNHVGAMKVTLQPQNEYFLMWKDEVFTETIWALAESDGKQLTFKPGETTKTVRYGYGKPNSPTGGEEPDWY